MAQRSRRATRVAVVLAWACSVILATAVAWWAVAVVAGEQVGSRGDRVLSQAEVATALAARASAVAGPGTEQVGQPPATSGATPTAVADGPTPVPSAGPGTSAPPPAEITSAPITTSTTTTGATTTSAITTSAKPPSSSPASPARTTRIWAVPGGQVSAECAGSQIGLLYATPADGWSVGVGSPGPAKVEVEFSRNDGESRVIATCVAGVPDKQASGEGD